MRFKSLHTWMILIFFMATLPIIAQDGTKKDSTDTMNQPKKTNTTSTDSDTIAKLKKEISKLNSEIKKLWLLTYNLKRQIPSKRTINILAARQARIIISRYMRSQKMTISPNVPTSYSKGGIKILHLVVGKDKGVEVLGRAGKRISLAVRGPKYYGSAAIAIYAVPVTDMQMRTKYLIYRDSRVPFFGGVAQIHFDWNGRFISRRRAMRGNYKIFAKVLVNNRKGERKGSAMRFWGIKFAASKTAFVIKIK